MAKWTPLHMLAKNAALFPDRSLSALSVLLEIGMVNLDAQTRLFDCTPLHIAISSRAPDEFIQFLVTKGADVEKKVG